MDKYTIAHIHNIFFAGSETFIYNYVSNHKRFKPICIATQFANLEQFPFPEADMYHIDDPVKFQYRWLKNKFIGIDDKIERIIRQRKAVLLHAHFGDTAIRALAMKRHLGIPMVTTFYGYDVSQRAKDEKWRKLYGVLFRHGEMFLAEGPFMKNRLIELGCPENKIRLQRIAIPVDKMPFHARTPKRPDEKTILIFCGRFVEKKGLAYALQAIKLLRQSFKNFEFRIVGDGTLKENVTAYIKENSMENYTKLLGFMPYTSYMDEMHKADIFIQPSVTAAAGDSEGGAPTTILEAQAIGLPVIATTHADIPNIVVPGKSALLSPEKDIMQLSDNIAQLLHSQNRWEQMGRHGHDFVCKYHDINNEILELENKYNDLIR